MSEKEKHVKGGLWLTVWLVAGGLLTYTYSAVTYLKVGWVRLKVR